MPTKQTNHLPPGQVENATGRVVKTIALWYGAAILGFLALCVLVVVIAS